MIKTLALCVPQIRRIYEQRNSLLLRVRELEARQAVLDDIAADVRHQKRQINTILRRTSSRRSSVRTLFVVHFAQNWSALEPIYLAMAAADDFDPVVAVVDFRLTDRIESQDRVSALLSRRGIPHLRWGRMDRGDCLDRNNTAYLLEYLDPDIVFRQTHFDASVPDGLRTPNSAGFRICYLPYQFSLCEVPDVIVNQEMHHAAWRIFCASAAHVAYVRQHSLLGGRNAVAVGHPRLDEIWEAARLNARWPDRKGTRRYRILWAPHHSVGNEWMRFGMFDAVWRDMLDFAARTPDVEVILRRHHILYDMLVQHKKMTPAEVEDFKVRWGGLDNTRVDDDPSYVGSFADSDVLLSDGVSFLGEYQVTGKPVVFLERRDHVAFTPIGERVVAGCYRAGSLASALEIIASLKSGADDRLAPVRDEISAEFRPYPGKAAERILDEIRNGLAQDYAERRSRPSGSD